MFILLALLAIFNTVITAKASYSYQSKSLSTSHRNTRKYLDNFNIHLFCCFVPSLLDIQKWTLGRLKNSGHMKKSLKLLKTRRWIKKKSRMKSSPRYHEENVGQCRLLAVAILSCFSDLPVILSASISANLLVKWGNQNHRLFLNARDEIYILVGEFSVFPQSRE